MIIIAAGALTDKRTKHPDNGWSTTIDLDARCKCKCKRVNVDAFFFGNSLLSAKFTSFFSFFFSIFYFSIFSFFFHYK